MNLKEFNSLTDLYFYQAKKQSPQGIFLEWLNPRNKVKFTWGDTSSSIYKMAVTLKENIKDGDRCLLVSENRPEWLITDIAIMLANGITVPAYTTYTEKDYKYLIEDCEPSIIIVSNSILHDKLKNIIDEKSFIKKVITFDKIENIGDENKYLNFSSIIKRQLKEVDKIENLNLKRNSPACIIYTSGTGGNPKGVILSHGGILNNLEGAQEILKPLINKKPIFLTWLPLSHSYEHTVQFVQIAVGAKVFYAEKIEKLLENISEAKPTIMTAVPRFYQNIYNKININMKKATGLKSKLITSTIVLGKKELLNQKMDFIEKIISFETNLPPGIWKQRVTLVADDPARPEREPYELFIGRSHTINSERLSKSIPDYIDIEKLYMVDFPEMKDASTFGVIKPEATQALFNQLSQGTAFVNYIGHGNPIQWAQEKLLIISDERNDISSINTNMKLPIWIAGTCNWGQFDNIDKESFAEELIRAPMDGASAIITTNRGISISSNIQFLENIFI